MIRKTSIGLSELYQSDETGWLEQMAALAAEADTAAMDFEHLSEYLCDMARRDKREVFSRLVVLLVHLLKWEHQPASRSRSWELTIAEHREALQDLFQSGTLRNFAEQELDNAYRKAVRRAAVEADSAEESFPPNCPYTLEQAIGDPLR